MNIQMVDLKRQYQKIRNEIDDIIADVISSTQFIGGKHVGEFEYEAAAYLGVKYAASCANGTDALQIALMSLGIGKEDEVITTPFSFVATAETIALIGAKPVYADIDEKSFNINPKKIKDKITPRTKAILPVHLYGNPAEMDEISLIAKEHNLYVIEDSAQAFGAEYKGKKVCGFGDAACISFFPSKNLGCYGDGGMITTNDQSIFNKVRMIVNHGSKVRYVHEILGVNSRLDALQAAILRVKLKYIDHWNESRINNANRYSTALKDIEGIILPSYDEHSRHIFHQYTLRVPRRDELQNFLKEKNIPSMIYYPIPLHLQPAFQGVSDEGTLPIAEKLSKEVISLPMHPDLTEEEINHITHSIKEFYS
jgi:dTDP-4-amino-4,6-dideoxygalactose transaminase